MSPYTIQLPADLARVEAEVMKALAGTTEGLALADLYRKVGDFGPAVVKQAVWHMVDKGTVRFESDWSVRAA